MLLTRKGQLWGMETFLEHHLLSLPPDWKASMAIEEAVLKVRYDGDNAVSSELLSEYDAADGDIIFTSKVTSMIRGL